MGVLSKEEALKLAQEKGLDLIEIAPTAKPPVAKIMSFDKFRYQKEKEFKKQRLAVKTDEFKQIRISVKAAQNDLLIKAKKVNEFLEGGSKVEIMMVLRGREKGNKSWARKKLDEFLKIIDPAHKVIMQPKDTGRGLVMQINKSK